MQNPIVLTLALLLSLAGCGRDTPTAAPSSAGDAPAAIEAGAGSIYERAVANEARSDTDRQRDALRHPAEVLEFFGIKPGMTVLDMFSGGGYYTELLSYVVGPEGRVVAHTNSAYAGYVGDETEKRYAKDRLPNVEILFAENNELALPAEEFDAVMLILAYHDIYYVDPANGWPKIDGPKLLAELKKALKPGGILAVVDHTAAAGAPRETGGSLHRIDPEMVISELATEGFVLEAKSNALRNTEDNYSKSVFDPEVRGRTDRFILKFRKPDGESVR